MIIRHVLPQACPGCWTACGEGWRPPVGGSSGCPGQMLLDQGTQWQRDTQKAGLVLEWPGAAREEGGSGPLTRGRTTAAGPVKDQFQAIEPEVLRGSRTKPICIVVRRKPSGWASRIPETRKYLSCLRWRRKEAKMEKIGWGWSREPLPQSTGHGQPS